MPEILGIRIDPTSYQEASSAVIGWAKAGETRKLAASNLHMLTEAWDDPDFAAQLRAFDIVTPDGMPLVWRLRQLGHTNQQRVYGPDLMLRICELAAAEHIPVGIYGGLPDALEATVAALRERFPGLPIVYAYSPPMRSTVGAEDETTLAEIRASGARILFVALGCPKQEKWIALNAPYLPMVLFAVGAAIDFISGRVAQAPAWVQRIGMEWLFRMLADPKRLVRRYVYVNTKVAGLWLAGRF